MSSPNGRSSASRSAARPRRQPRTVERTDVDIGRRRGLLSRLRRDARSGVPGLLVSAVVHGAALIVLALLLIPFDRTEELETILLGWATERPEPEQAALPVQIHEPILLDPVNPQPRRRQTETSEETGPEPVADPAVAPVDVSGALGGRLGAFDAEENAPGGNDEARRAVFQALGWLARQQQPDGRWRLDDGYSDAGRIETDTGATALALLAFLGAGQTHRHGEHQQTVGAGLNWLRSVQRPDGDLFDIAEQGREAHFYAHSQATIALCEALALTGDETLRTPAERAIAFLVAAQNPVLGGWKYRPLDETGIGDLSVTGWALMALHTARMADIDLPPEAYLAASRFLDSVQETPDNAAFYKYRPDWPATDEQRWSMTAEGLLCRQWLGWPRAHSAMHEGVAYLLSEENEPTWEAGRRNVYAWYYTAQVLHNLASDAWAGWFAGVQRLVVDHQGPDGSWHPTRPPGAFLEHARTAGRLYITVMCVLILETPVRHAPIYEEPTTVSRSFRVESRIRPAF